jgi:hypothetical protein
MYIQKPLHKSIVSYNGYVNNYEVKNNFMIIETIKIKKKDNSKG